jgi:S-DNA-T family DNA segregation ATPase FtsK/SpoIIIE
LPPRLPIRSLPRPPAPLIALGLTDLPDEQRQPVLAWDPVARPRMLVVGDPGSGRSTALAAIAVGLDALPLPSDPAVLWDRLAERERPLLVDDLDHLLDRLGETHRSAAVERLAVRLRDPSAAPTVATVRGPSAWAGLPLRAVTGLFDETVLLALGLDDHLALGGARSTWSARIGPGRGWCSGARVQLALLPAAEPEPAPTAPVVQDGPIALLTTRPRSRAGGLTAAGWSVVAPGEAASGRWTALVGTPAEWQTEWRALPALRSSASVLVDGCGPGDVRTLLGVADPLPPVTHPDDVVLIPPEGAPYRVRLP